MEGGDGDEEEGGRKVSLSPLLLSDAICCQLFAFTPWAELNSKRIFMGQISVDPRRE